MTVILASASETRRLMLERAGVPVTCRPTNLDEAGIKRQAAAQGTSAAGAAGLLAERKAGHAALDRPDALIIGADQMLDCDGQWFDKPNGRDEARAQLRALRGRRHVLSSAAVVVAGRTGTVLWRRVEQADLTMRPFSDGFLEWYLDAAGDAVCHSVGAYRIEGLGVQLFSEIHGDHSVILGLPLVPLLEMLRDCQELQR
jgi:septum formation protein